MKLVRESIQLNEEYIGNIGTSLLEAEVYKNPRSLKRMEPEIRGITTEDGNFYIVNSPYILHIELIDYLKNVKHLIPKHAGWTGETFEGIVAWSRYGSSPLFFL